MNSIANLTVRYEIDGQTFASQLLYDESHAAPRPGLLMAPNWMGVSAGAIEIAQQVAARGYVVLVADVYGADLRPQGMDEAGAAMMTVKGKPALRQRLQAALDSLKAQPGIPLDSSRLAVFGFCFGGHCALEMARSGAALQAAVSFHGTLDSANPAEAQNIKGSVLVLDGAADPFVPRTQLTEFAEEMGAAGVDWQLISYGRAVHSFTDPQANIPGKMQYDAKVSHRAFAAMYDLFDEVFA
ncbi:dienelactone hydrolase family protein [Aquipseudomonas ullengensis]|uniref:Dienelactone hydrolase family protein n=1 Tax=Aquipseudomonas ullengensis TaxID=2759166 RepID=A0A7W4LNA4_9GAMM|nr:dienelactone hydrolase family protein [Pseudomonas ullengensis]MBB2496268.1 dienelactone hydrolase family protein [Pseudomonas ullengensis]